MYGIQLCIRLATEEQARAIMTQMAALLEAKMVCSTTRARHKGAQSRLLHDMELQAPGSCPLLTLSRSAHPLRRWSCGTGLMPGC